MPCQVIEAPCSSRMIHAVDSLINSQRASVKRVSFGIVALGTMQIGQVVKARGHIGMVGAVDSFINGQRASVQRFCLYVATVIVINGCQVVKARGHVGVVGPPGPFPNRQRSPGQQPGRQQPERSGEPALIGPIGYDNLD